MPWKHNKSLPTSNLTKIMISQHINHCNLTRLLKPWFLGQVSREVLCQWHLVSYCRLSNCERSSAQFSSVWVKSAERRERGGGRRTSTSSMICQSAFNIIIECLDGGRVDLELKGPRRLGLEDLERYNRMLNVIGHNKHWMSTDCEVEIKRCKDRFLRDAPLTPDVFLEILVEAKQRIKEGGDRGVHF